MNANNQALANSAQAQWTTVCEKSDLPPNAGLCALVNGRQIALFYSKTLDRVFALDNYDPIGKANVLSRGIIGSIGEAVVVASPLYKQHFDLHTGECLEEPEVSVRVYPAEVTDDWVRVQA